MTRLIVWKVIGWVPIKHGQNAGEGDCYRVAFKHYDKTPGTIYLNLPEQRLFNGFNKLYPCLKEGNILDMTLWSNGKNVNFFYPWNIYRIKPKNKEVNVAQQGD